MNDLTLGGHFRCRPPNGEPGHSDQARQPSYVRRTSKKSNRPSTNTTRRSKRKKSSQDHDEDDDDGDGPEPRNSCPGSSEELGGFACPFYIYNRLEHRQCAPLRFRAFADVKQHLLQRAPRHIQPAHCPRCGIEFASYDDRDIHVNVPNSQVCAQRHFPVFPGMSQDQERLIRNIPTGARPSPEAKWFRVWAILFGRDTPPPLSPRLIGDGNVEFLEELGRHARDNHALLHAQWTSQLMASAMPEQRLEAVSEIVQVLAQGERRRVQERQSRPRRQSRLAAEPHQEQLSDAYPASNAATDGYGGYFVPDLSASVSNPVLLPPVPVGMHVQPPAYGPPSALETPPTQQFDQNRDWRTHPVTPAYFPSEFVNDFNPAAPNWNQFYQAGTYTENDLDTSNQHGYEPHNPDFGDLDNAAQQGRDPD